MVVRQKNRIDIAQRSAGLGEAAQRAGAAINEQPSRFMRASRYPALKRSGTGIAVPEPRMVIASGIRWLMRRSRAMPARSLQAC